MEIKHTYPYQYLIWFAEKLRLSINIVITIFKIIFAMIKKEKENMHIFIVIDNAK